MFSLRRKFLLPDGKGRKRETRRERLKNKCEPPRRPVGQSQSGMKSVRCENMNRRATCEMHRTYFTSLPASDSVMCVLCVRGRWPVFAVVLICFILFFTGKSPWRNLVLRRRCVISGPSLSSASTCGPAGMVLVLGGTPPLSELAPRTGELRRLV